MDIIAIHPRMPRPHVPQLLASTCGKGLLVRAAQARARTPDTSCGSPVSVSSKAQQASMARGGQESDRWSLGSECRTRRLRPLKQPSVTVPRATWLRGLYMPLWSRCMKAKQVKEAMVFGLRGCSKRG